ncbi:AraC-like DNA-binding protein [Rhodoblastus sphagnicola]|nr:AraC-like DNA-binding protein [Rhodoblastus sphagnicola]
MRTIYVAPERVPPGFGDAPEGYVVTPLLRELIVRTIYRGEHDVDAARRARLANVLFDELDAAPIDSLSLALPKDARLARACADILDTPGGDDSLAALARSSGASTRTLARLAHEEFGCALSVWRQQARILAAAPMLIAGESVIRTSQALGYETPGAFSAMFKRIVGVTPRAFVAGRCADRSF